LREGRDGDGDSEGAFRRLFSALQGIDKHFEGLAGVGGDKNSGPEKAALDPGLASFGKTIAAEERQPQPALLLRFVAQFSEGSPRADGQGFVLSGRQVD